MRWILVDLARRKRRAKHGAGLQLLDIASIDLPVTRDAGKCLQIHELLEELQAEDAAVAEVVKLRIFVGLRGAEIAAVMAGSEKKVQRLWSYGKAWLSRRLKPHS